jgi:diguanylate cyclase (GGDEF)-like protein
MTQPRPRILVVEDTRFFAKVVKKAIERRLGFEVVAAGSFAEAERVLDDPSVDLFLALLDLNLPDAPDGEIVDFVISRGVPVIVFTGQFDPVRRSKILSKNVIDYVIKDTPSSLDYMIALIDRIHRNRSLKALVVDDSRVMRKAMSRLLSRAQFQMLEAADGEEALAVLREHPDLSLVVTDYNMPKMDGFELTRRIRSTHSRDDLVIIGLSGDTDGVTSAKFIKYGANDYLSKPVHTEELFCRVHQGLQLVDHVHQLRHAATTDYLTQLYNRRYLFEEADKLLKRSRSTGAPIHAAMLDIDFFKRVNDTYGHDAGDEVLKGVSNQLAARFGTGHLLARMGGEEFCVLSSGQDVGEQRAELDALRADLEGTTFHCDDQDINVTISIGLASGQPSSISELLTQADELLYRAKDSGRNRVVMAT